MSDDKINKIGKRYGDLSDLPEELKSQLNVGKSDELEEQIVWVMNNYYDGVANIDEILIALYRKFGVIQKRTFVVNKLYRMGQTGCVFSIKGKKGAYRTDLAKENNVFS